MKQEWTEELEYLEEEGMEEKDSTKEEQEERELAISFYMDFLLQIDKIFHKMI